MPRGPAGPGFPGLPLRPGLPGAPRIQIRGKRKLVISGSSRNFTSRDVLASVWEATEDYCYKTELEVNPANKMQIHSPRIGYVH